MTKAEQARRLAWRFKVVQQAGERSRNVARTCRHFGISRQAFYRWKRRYEALGAAGLADRPSTPQRSPRATPREVVSKILYLRQTYHFGPGRIADYLKRFHQRALAVSSVHRILVRHGLNRLPSSQKHRAHAKRWQRYEKPQPGHRLQMDVKFLERIPGSRKRFYQFTAIDDGSIRRECLDHVIVFNQRHLRRVLRTYVAYYQRSRTHLALGNDAPVERAVHPTGRIVARPEVGGLHHRYERQAA